MKRYYKPEIQKLRQQALSKIYGFSPDGYFVYVLIRRVGRAKIPFYVGETGNPKDRFKTHLATAYGGFDAGSRINKYWGDIIKRGESLEMYALNKTATKIDALCREVGWTRILKENGYLLQNMGKFYESGCKQQTLTQNLRKSLHLSKIFEKKCIIVCKCKSCLVTFELRHDEISKIEIGDPMVCTLQKKITCPQCHDKIDFFIHPPANEKITFQVQYPSELRLNKFLLTFPDTQ